MENQDTVRILAKSKVKLAAAVTLLLILAGLAAEYVRHEKPLDEATVVLLKPKAEAVAVVEDDARQAEAEAMAAENEEQLRRNREGAAEFFRYMEEIHERAEAVVKPESALHKIIPQQPQPAEAQPEVPVNEQVIEVYDESGEVVEIVEVRGESTAAEVASESVSEAVSEGAQAEVFEEVSAESAEGEKVTAEPVVNTEENHQEIIETEAEAPALDMMKDIIAREQAAAEENNSSN